MDTRELDDATYVRLTTFRRDGRAVSCPVWLARAGDGYGFTCDLDSGKVKRLRNDQRLEVAVCDRRGRVAAGTTVYAGRGRVLEGAEADEVHAAIVRRHPVLARMIDLGGDVARRVRRRAPEPRGAVTLRVTATR